MMLVNAVLHKNGERRIPRNRDLREILKKTIDLRKSMGLAENGAGHKSWQDLHPPFYRTR